MVTHLSIVSKTAKLTEGEDPRYLHCDLPDKKKSVSIFLNGNGSKVLAVSSRRRKVDMPLGEEWIFIGLLNLEKLGIRDQFSRIFGKLDTLYVVKNEE